MTKADQEIILGAATLPDHLRQTLLSENLSYPVLSEARALEGIGALARLFGLRFEGSAPMRLHIIQKPGTRPTIEPTAAYQASLEWTEKLYDSRDELFRLLVKGKKADALRVLETYLELSGVSALTSVTALQQWLQFFNSQCELALSGAGVHPFYRQQYMRKTHIEIYEQQQMEELRRYPAVLVENYCRLVQDRGAQGHSALVQKVISYIDLHEWETLSLRTLAEAAGRSEGYLATQFKKEMGVTVVQYVNARRMDEAARLLAQGESVQGAALQAGISNQGYFCRLFKRCFSVTPQQYRKAHYTPSG